MQPWGTLGCSSHGIVQCLPNSIFQACIQCESTAWKLTQFPLSSLFKSYACSLHARELQSSTLSSHWCQAPNCFFRIELLALPRSNAKSYLCEGLRTKCRSQWPSDLSFAEGISSYFTFLCLSQRPTSGSSFSRSLNKSFVNIIASQGVLAKGLLPRRPWCA